MRPILPLILSAHTYLVNYLLNTYNNKILLQKIFLILNEFKINKKYLTKIQSKKTLIINNSKMELKKKLTPNLSQYKRLIKAKIKLIRILNQFNKNNDFLFSIKILINNVFSRMIYYLIIKIIIFQKISYNLYVFY